MHETLKLILALVAGAMLGAIFFGGLWWTIRQGLSSRQPAVWFLGSLLARMGLTLGGFYLVGGGDWERLLSCLIGFVLARVLVTWLTRAGKATQASHILEGKHAS